MCLYVKAIALRFLLGWVGTIIIKIREQRMLNFSSRALLALFIFVCVTSAAAQSPSTTTSPPKGQVKVVVIPLFGDDAASKWRGLWVTDTAYKKSDIIEFDGSSYIAVSDHQSALSNIPPEAGLWNLVAASGANGAAGAPGTDGADSTAVGPKGDKGETGADSTVVGPKGDVGDKGVAGDKGDQGETGPQGTAANAVDAICVALGSTAGCDLVTMLAPEFPKLVFVTSTTHNGDLGGLAGADQICNNLASAQNIEGEFKAWISDGNGSPSGRFTRSEHPYRLVDGTAIAQNYDWLSSGYLDHPIGMDEVGSRVLQGEVWTDTDSFGNRWSGNHCGGWTDIDALGVAGDAGHRNLL
jgi:hypothetical protein